MKITSADGQFLKKIIVEKTLSSTTQAQAGPCYFYLKFPFGNAAYYKIKFRLFSFRPAIQDDPVKYDSSEYTAHIRGLGATYHITLDEISNQAKMEFTAPGNLPRIVSHTDLATHEVCYYLRVGFYNFPNTTITFTYEDVSCVGVVPGNFTCTDDNMLVSALTQETPLSTDDDIKEYTHAPFTVLPEE
jgi:hypothetical protein